MNRHKQIITGFVILYFIILTACTSQTSKNIDESVTVSTQVNGATSIIIENATPENSEKESLTEKIDVWFSPALPLALREGVKLSSQTEVVQDVTTASMWLDVLKPGQNFSNFHQSVWVYALVAPFPTLTEDVNLDEILRVWKGEAAISFPDKPLLLSTNTHMAFEAIWGPANGNGLQIVDKDSLIETAWNERPTWALIPFEDIEPRWKVLRINGLSPLDRNINLSDYPLVVSFGWAGEGVAWDALQKNPDQEIIDFPAINRDEKLMTTLVLTGTTALVRSTALRMEEESIIYPARDIGEWLSTADFAHMSNEVPFYSRCPSAVPLRREARFCSDPKYIELLEYLGIDLVELTGNHLLDWGTEALTETLDIYKQHQISYYGGGENLEIGRKPILLEHNGNRLALIGCNAIGPESDWATEDQPGSASCDMKWLEEEVKHLSNEGYLPIVTFQHFEVCDFKPQSTQRIDFEHMAEIGAVIVSGSQSHCPQGMTFVGDHFVHFGLGNLFFDQMDYYTSREFIDRHIFYNGRYINTQLLTAMLEDYSRPRPMNNDERNTFLEEVFQASEWK